MPNAGKTQIWAHTAPQTMEIGYLDSIQWTTILWRSEMTKYYLKILIQVSPHLPPPSLPHMPGIASAYPLPRYVGMVN